MLADIGLTYHVTPGVDATFRVNNLFDKTYVNWAEVSYPSEVILGAPRSVTFGLTMKF